MAVKKVYAVRKGRVKGIFYSWEDCKSSVEGFAGAEYKGFAILSEALNYMEQNEEAKGIKQLSKEKQPIKSSSRTTTDSILKAGQEGKNSTRKENKEKSLRNNKDNKTRAELPDSPDTLLAYVDGSYDHSIRKYAFGCVFILPDGTVYTESGNGDNPASLALRNVTGEMLGSMFAVKFALFNGFHKIEICYDYEGIEKWVTGAWRSKTELTKKYAASMRQWRERIDIHFRKVSAHTNIYYNEMADQLAKAALTGGNGVPKVRRTEEMEPWSEAAKQE